MVQHDIPASLTRQNTGAICEERRGYVSIAILEVL
ncbi:hypothetical protein M7I_0669 [Glarea lozoyensis 74030]|uniref:Uncharacterized protein n=1 Tax=Glarea lozoyensis (strain ATCC 74030 / MF5533) TaxID=1104152 RepID=H0EE01_GLAL7|nr:hypothetical protein M7I_0669 [Glarea lozoyensis 74030]